MNKYKLTFVVSLAFFVLTGLHTIFYFFGNITTMTKKTAGVSLLIAVVAAIVLITNFAFEIARLKRQAEVKEEKYNKQLKLFMKQ